MALLRDFRRVADALERLAAGQAATRQSLEAYETVIGRLESLELDRHQFEAEMEGLLLKAEGKLKAANNSEARERHQREKHEDNTDPFPEDGDEVQRRLQELDAEEFPAEELHPVHMGLEKNSKAYALRAKYS